MKSHGRKKSRKKSLDGKKHRKKTMIIGGMEGADGEDNYLQDFGVLKRKYVDESDMQLLAMRKKYGNFGQNDTNALEVDKYYAEQSYNRNIDRDYSLDYKIKCMYAYPNGTKCWKTLENATHNYCDAHEYIDTPKDRSLSYLKKKKLYIPDVYNIASYSTTDLDINETIVVLKYIQEKYKNACVFTGVLNPHNKSYYRSFPAIHNEPYLMMNEEIVADLKECYDNLRLFGYRFIIIPLALLYRNEGHLNMMIYDNRDNSLIRFDPHGKVVELFQKTSDRVDKSILYELSKIFLIKKYDTPSDLYKDVGDGPQVRERDRDVRFGDPNGFCIWWSSMFADMRLGNPDLSVENIIEVFHKIVKRQDYTAIVRNYSEKFVKLLAMIHRDLEGITNMDEYVMIENKIISDCISSE